jgi:hypothetical protein
MTNDSAVSLCRRGLKRYAGCIHGLVYCGPPVVSGFKSPVRPRITYSSVLPEIVREFGEQDLRGFIKLYPLL